MSIIRDCCENSTDVGNGMEKLIEENVSNLDTAKKKIEELSSSEHTVLSGKERQDDESEALGDEGDGFLKKLKKVGSAVTRKKGSRKEEIEPYCKAQGNWTYSAISGENRNDVDDDDDDDRAESDDTVGKNIEETFDITENNCYNFTHPNRGYLLLVINEKFYNQATRTGAHLDLLKMKSIAEKFGFEILNEDAETNMTKSETLNWLNKAQHMDHSECDCFMFMISTHGLEQPNPRMGGKLDHALVCADDQLLFTSSIVEMFNETNCESLKGKPKIFIVQACRGNSVDHGSDVKIGLHEVKPIGNVKDKRAMFDKGTYLPSDEHDTKPAKDSWSKDETRDIETPFLKCYVDMLIMYAIPPGMLAWRNTTDGSWMIHYMHEILMSYDMKAPTCFLKNLIKISRKMASRSTDTPSMPEMHEKKAIPVIEHMLTRDILFSTKH